LCLQYLTFDCFESDIGQDELEDFATNGYFVLQDYAIANWSHHLRAMVESGQLLIAGDLEAHDAMRELDDALTDFANNYDQDLSQVPVIASYEETCKAFKECNFYPSLQLVWSHICVHKEKGFDARDDVSLKSLSDALALNRKLLEDLTSSRGLLVDRETRLNSLYGNKRYKCPKVTCVYFHEGYKDAKSRDMHINRHDRPFRCTFPDCSVAEFGFGSSKELERHERLFHPRISDTAMTFPTPKAVVAQTKWACHICPKRFTRGFHLRSHIRTHTAERPFPCSECGKTFTRANDRKRHEKIHERR
jgi:hypothetical protein